MTIQPMVLTAPLGKKHSNGIFTNETLLWIITNPVLLTLFFIVFNAPVVHQRACHTTRSSKILEMMHHHPTPEEGLVDEGDQDECNDNLLMNYIENKKWKNKWLYIFWGNLLLSIKYLLYNFLFCYLLMHEPCMLFSIHVPYFFHLPLIIVFLLVMHDCIWGIESDAWGEGSNEFPPSRGCLCLVENKLLLKPRESHSLGIPL